MRIHHSFPKSVLSRSLPLALAVSGMTATVSAQEKNVRQLEEVVVTAQKREQLLTDVPISVDAFSGESLKDAGVQTIRDLPTMVPGMRIDQQGSFSQPTIRGIGSSTAGAGFTSNVATYIDGYYVPSQLGTDMQLLNLQSVQVLKGPQGTLFGRNATGGAILLETKDASYEPTLEIEATAARYAKRGLNFYASTGITDKLAVDIAGIYWEGDGFLDNIVTGDDDSGAYDEWKVRVSALYEPTDDISIEFAYSHGDKDNPFNNAKGVYDGHTVARFFPGALIPDDWYEFASTAPVEYTHESDGYFLTADWMMGGVTAKSLTMYRKEDNHSELDLDSTNISIFAVEFTPKNETFTQEFNFSGQIGGIDWIAGVFYMDYEETYDCLCGTEIPLQVYEQIGNNIDSWAVFADATYGITDRLDLIFGIRYGEEDATAFVTNPDIPEWEASWDAVTPRAILRYEPSEDSSVYVSYSEGFKAGQLNPSGFSAGLDPIDQEEVKAYEVGYKLNTGEYLFEAAAYSYDYQDMQVASFNGVAALVTNAASSTIKGGEVKFGGFLTDSITFNLGAAYTKSEYDEFPGSQPRQLNPTQPGYLGILVGDADGNQMLRSPEWSAVAGLQYTGDIAGGELILSGNLYYSDDFYFDANQQFLQESYTLLNLRAKWVAPNGKYNIAVFGTNVTDEEYANQVLPGNFDVQRGYGEPSVWGVTLGYSY